MATRLDDEDHETDNHAGDRRPDVRAQAQVDLARVDPDRLPDDASCAIPDEVQREELAPLQAHPAPDPEEEEHTERVPDHLVQEGRVEQGALGQARGEGRVRGLDLEPPGQIGGQAEQLVVEPVAEPPDRLGEQQPWRQGVGERPEADPGPLAPEPCADRAADEGAVDRDAALPDIEHRPDVLARPEIEARV
ncbi:hypothetical protein ABE10_02495, partial [Bacillus toyonensis]|nr:hypothetical protein [Bacillus toyonensis]